MPDTTRDTVRILLQTVMTRLENQKAISVETQKRQDLVREAVESLGRGILTEEDIRNKTLVELGAKGDELVDIDFTQSQQYRTARSLIRKQFGENELKGMYYQKTLRELAKELSGFLMTSPNVEEVFESDDALEKAIIQVIHRFNPEELH